MAGKDIVYSPETADKPTLTVVPLPRLRLPLKTASDLRREMARVYREARAGKLDTSEAARLVYILAQIGKAYELNVIEKRLAVLESITGPKWLK